MKLKAPFFGGILAFLNGVLMLKYGYTEKYTRIDGTQAYVAGVGCVVLGLLLIIVSIFQKKKE